MKKIVRLATAVTALLVTTAATAQTVTLNLKKATKYETVAESKASMSVEAMGQTMEMTTDSKSTTVYEVKDNRSTEFDLVKTLIRSTMSMTMPGQEMNYDSDKKDNDPKVAEAMGARVGKPVNITINQKGDVLKSDAPKTEGEAGGMMDGFLNASKVSETDDLVASQALNRSLKAGDQWQDSVSTKAEKMSMKIAGVYTVKSVENGLATVSFNGVQTTNGTMEQAGMEMTTSGNNKISTDLTINVSTGIVQQRKTTIAINMNIETMGMTMPTTGTVTSTTVVKELQ